MEVFCLAEFKTSYETLSKNNSYSNLKNLINTDLVNLETAEKHASQISGTPDIPYFKKDWEEALVTVRTAYIYKSGWQAISGKHLTENWI